MNSAKIEAMKVWQEAFLTLLVNILSLHFFFLIYFPLPQLTNPGSVDGLVFRLLSSPQQNAREL